MMEADDNTRFDLCSDDRRILDQLVDVAFDVDALEPLSETDRRRATHVARMFGLLNDYPVIDADDALTDVTMARIDQHDRQIASHLTLHRTAVASDEVIEPSHSVLAGIRHWRFPDFLTVAASLLVVASICFPMLRPADPTFNGDVTMALNEPIEMRSNEDLASIFDVTRFFEGGAAATDEVATAQNPVKSWMIWSPGRVTVVSATRGEVAGMLNENEFALPITAVFVYRDAQNQPRARSMIRHDEQPIQFSADDWQRWRSSPSPIDLPVSPLLDRPAMDLFPLY